MDRWVTAPCHDDCLQWSLDSNGEVISLIAVGHANSFYQWQDFMEGAALSGIETAQQILQGIKAGQFG